MCGKYRAGMMPVLLLACLLPSATVLIDPSVAGAQDNNAASQPLNLLPGTGNEVKAGPVSVPAAAKNAPVVGTPLTDAEAIAQQAQPVTQQSAQADQPATGTAPLVRVRAGKHPTFDRLVFDWNRKVDYQIERQGDRVVIRFDQPGRADLASVRFMELGFGDSVRDIGGRDGLAVQMDVPAGAELKDFRLDDKVVLDIVRKVDADRPTPAIATPARATPPAAVPKPTPPAVSARADRPTNEPTTTDKTAETSTGTEHAAAGQAALAVAPTGSVDLVSPAADAKQDAAGDPAVTQIRIDPNIPTAATVFVRSDTLWVVFPLKAMNVSPLVEGPAAGLLRRADIFTLDGGTAYQFPLPPGLHPRAELDGRVWQIDLSPVATPLPSAKIDIEGTDVSAGKRLSINMEAAGSVLEMVDPAIGDRLLLVPSAIPGSAVRQSRRLPEFELLPAVQGLVVRPLVNGLEVKPGTDSVKIERHSGLLLSADHRTLMAAGLEAPVGTDQTRLFDLEAWGRGPLEKFDDNRVALQAQISALEGKDRSLAILDLARLYFVHGFAAEAVGLIRLATELDPELGDKTEIIALRGAAEALNGTSAGKALDDLSIDALKDEPEAALWRGVALSREGRWGKAGQEFLKSGDLIIGYPDGIFTQISTIMAEALLVNNELDVAQSIIDELARRGEHIRINRDALDYLRGDIQMRRGNPEEGQSLWRQVAEHGHDQLYRVKAKLGLVEAGLARGEMTKPDAIEALEKLRFAWRGDTLELAILRRLGTLYLDNGDYFAGFELLRRAAGYFPGSRQAEVLTADMAQAFRQLFVEGKADELSPIEAYGIFDQFRELNPIGKTGDLVIQHLAERLIGVDLLGEAGELLQQQVEFRVTGQEKARLGARLAGVRLLDNQPDLALEALEISKVDDSLSPALIQERLLLEARALQLAGKPEEGLAAIAGLTSEASDRLRADIGWRSGKWKVAARALNALLRDDGATGDLSPADRHQFIMNTAIALSLGGDQAGLNRLRDEYDQEMQQTPFADSFQLVTRPLTASLLADVNTLRQQVQEVDLFSGFLGSYRHIQDGSISGADSVIDSVRQDPPKRRSPSKADEGAAHQPAGAGQTAEVHH